MIAIVRSRRLSRPARSARRNNPGNRRPMPLCCSTEKICRHGAPWMAARRNGWSKTTRWSVCRAADTSAHANALAIASCTWNGPRRSAARQRPRPGQQRRLFWFRPLRSSSARFVPKPNLRGRLGGVGLWPVSAAGECFAAARPMAMLRHRLDRAAI